MLNFYITICDKNPEVLILDSGVLGTRSYLQINREYDRPLIIFVKCDRISKKSAQHLWRISLKFKYEINLLQKDHTM